MRTVGLQEELGVRQSHVVLPEWREGMCHPNVTGEKVKAQNNPWIELIPSKEGLWKH